MKQLQNNKMVRNRTRHIYLNWKSMSEGKATQHDTSIPTAIHVFILNIAFQFHQIAVSNKHFWENWKCVIPVVCVCVRVRVRVRVCVCVCVCV